MRRDSVRLFLKYAVTPRTVRRAVKMALVVGPILTAINQSQRIVALDLDLRFFLQMGLTFCVPYLVSTVSSAMTELVTARQSGQATAPDAPGDAARRP
jgi:hypothetical protein